MFGHLLLTSIEGTQHQGRVEESRDEAGLDIPYFWRVEQVILQPAGSPLSDRD